MVGYLGHATITLGGVSCLAGQNCSTQGSGLGKRKDVCFPRSLHMSSGSGNLADEGNRERILSELKLGLTVSYTKVCSVVGSRVLSSSSDGQPRTVLVWENCLYSVNHVLNKC